MNEDQVQFPLSTISYDHTTLAISCPNLQNYQQDQGAILREQLSQQQHQSNEHMSVGGSSVQMFFNTEPAVDHTREEQTDAPPVKWMSSKMRLMRKMMGEDRIIVRKQGGQGGLQDQAQSNPGCCSSSSSSNGNNSPTEIIRICSNCSTTKTPLWRSGPQGPKSLCNACGIRQMKARRALRAAATAAANGGSVLVPATSPPRKAPKEERSEVDRTVPFKKRFKIATSSSAQKKLRFDDITISLTKKLAFHQAAFPQEEKDAAILLMALSCGLIHG